MKDPAFLFYPTDFNDGTQDFTNEEVGAYLRLLLFQFSQGHLSLDRIKKRLGNSFDDLWITIRSKFTTDENGLYYNIRLEEEQNKRRKFSESRRENISKRYNKDTNYTCTTHVEHMENGNEDVNISKIIDKDNTPYNEIFIFYNENRNKLPECKKITDKRKTLIKARINEYDLETVKSVITSAGKSNFLAGENDRKWIADFDFIFTQSKFLSILEGKYGCNTTTDDPYAKYKHIGKNGGFREVQQ